MAARRVTQSMTGFGRGVRQERRGSVTVEIRSTNHRYLEIDQRLPSGFVALEGRITELIRGRVQRGRVDVFVSVRGDAWSARRAGLDETLLAGYHDALLGLKRRFGLPGRVTVEQLLTLPQAVRVVEERAPADACWHTLRPAAEQALRQLVGSRGREGATLVADVRRQLRLIEQHVRAVTRRLPQAMAQQRRRLRQRIKELLGERRNGSLGRLGEVAALVKDTDVHEELVRLHSHLAHMRQTLARGPLVGKQLDFIAQELTREINTLGAKVNDAVAIRHVVDVKSCIDKIREQAQNLE